MKLTLPYELFIGLRYLRAKRRQKTISLNTFVSVSGITLGVAALIGTLGIMTGFKEDLQEKILGTTSHIIVQDRTKENVGAHDALVSQLESLPRVIAATPFIYKQVLLTSRSGVQGIVLRGIDPIKEVEVTELGKNIKEGHLEDLVTHRSSDQEDPKTLTDDPTIQPTPKIRRGIILGKELARRLGVFVGDRVNVVSPVGPIKAISMVPKIRPFQVVAIFQSGMYEYDSSLAYISLAEAQHFFNLNDEVTGIEVKVDNIFEAATIARSIETTLGRPFWARDWMEMNRNLFAALKLEKTMMFLLLVLITLVASFNIVSTLTMIVNEKQREIAILKTMGATKKAIMRIFMVNGLIIGLTGTLIGIPLGYAFLWLIQTYWTFDPSVYYISKIPVHIQAIDVILVSCSALLISFLATILPSRQAAKLDPAAALRYE